VPAHDDHQIDVLGQVASSGLLRGGGVAEHIDDADLSDLIDPRSHQVGDECSEAFRRVRCLGDDADLSRQIVRQLLEGLVLDHDSTPPAPTQDAFDLRMGRVAENDDREAAFSQISGGALRAGDELARRVNHAQPASFDVSYNGLADSMRRDRDRVGADVVGGAIVLDHDPGVLEFGDYLGIVNNLAQSGHSCAVGGSLLHHVDGASDAEAEAHIAGAVNFHAAAPGLSERDRSESSPRSTCSSTKCAYTPR